MCLRFEVFEARRPDAGQVQRLEDPVGRVRELVVQAGPPLAQEPGGLPEVVEPVRMDPCVLAAPSSHTARCVIRRSSGVSFLEDDSTRILVEAGRPANAKRRRISFLGAVCRAS